MSALMFVRDGRTLPFVPVTVAAMEAIRRATPKRRPYAVTTYLALLEFANENRSDRVALSQREIVERVGASRSTVQSALGDLQTAGVLIVHERIHGNARVENEYVIVEPEGLQDFAPSPVTKATPAREASEGRPSGKQRSLEENPKKAPTALEERAPAKGFQHGRAGKVSDEVAESAERLLAVFNESTGSKVKARKRSGDPTSELKQVAGAMLDHEDVSEAEWAAGVRGMVASPPSWMDGPWIVGSMFGRNSSAHTIARSRPIAASAGGLAGGNVHPIGRRPSRFETAQAGLAELHARFIAEDGR